MRTTILGVIAITSTMTFACTMTETVTRTESESAKTEPSVVKPTDVGFKSKLAVAKSKITSLVAKRATTTTGKLGVRSGGSACGLSTGDTTCDSCLDGSCCTENKACVADADCTALIACGNACTDDACLAGCFSAHPTGVAILETLSTCVETSCSSACGGGGGGWWDRRQPERVRLRERQYDVRLVPRHELLRRRERVSRRQELHRLPRLRVRLQRRGLRVRV
jgi:hypothetical protein